ncbi:MAG TPA: hypothetical protein VFC56_16960 [Stellaceae bacterium]|nr:hypothetical protein [Stellaceae bacterium]
MSKKEFSEFISRQKPPVEEQPIDWRLEKEEWLRYLDDLYKLIENFLKEYTDRGQITVTYSDIELIEENIGRYTARAMMLAFGTNRLTLTPIGTLLIGTKGRVDLSGPKGTVRLILADKNSTGIKIVVRSHVLGHGDMAAESPAPEEMRKPDWEWKVVVTNAPQLRYQSLTQEAFFDALMEVSNA